MNYTQTPTELRIQPPEIVICGLSITQENQPYIVTFTDNQESRYSEPFKFHFHCKVKDKEGWLDIDFDFYEDKPINYAEYTWIEAAKKWLLPELGIDPDLLE
jgi:hypothetical protein